MRRRVEFTFYITSLVVGVYNKRRPLVCPVEKLTEYKPGGSALTMLLLWLWKLFGGKIQHGSKKAS